MKLYVDTNIFLDYLLERKNVFGKGISRPAQKLFYRAMSCEFFIVLSNHTATEINKKISLTQATMLFEFLKKKIVNVYFSEEDIEKARSIDSKNISDALHVVLAKKSGCDFIITRNMKDFRKYALWVEPKTPENI